MTTHAFGMMRYAYLVFTHEIRRGHITRTFLRIAYNPVFKDRAEDSIEWISPAQLLFVDSDFQNPSSTFVAAVFRQGPPF